MERTLKTVGASICPRTVAVLAALSFIALSPVALAGPKGTDRPLKGGCDATFTQRAPGPVPTLEVLDINLACHFTHLGLTTGTAVQVVNVGVFPFSISTTIEYVAANGDRLYAQFAGIGIPDPSGIVTFNGGTTYDGGTGRFLHATGASVDSGDASLVTQEGSIEVSGEISY